MQFHRIPAILFLLLPSLLFAQVMDKSYTDCDGNTESIYDVIGTGKPLIIASKGFDCSICMGEADEVRDFANENPGIRVWGAMNYKYSGATPACPALNNWRTTYSWNNIFMFNDVNDDWVSGGFPNYMVISPVDSSIAYNDFQFSVASSVALSLMTTALPHQPGTSFNISTGNGVITLSCSGNCEGVNTLRLIGISGQIILENEFTLLQGQERSFNFTEKISPGMYIAQISSAHSSPYVSKIMVR